MVAADEWSASCVRAPCFACKGTLKNCRYIGGPMSFRGRLFIFFTIIVIVPMAAVAVVLFRITSDSETGKSDARIAQGLTTALAVYQADVDRVHSALADVAGEPHMSRALARGKKRPIRLLARRLLERDKSLVAITYYDT